MEELKQLVDDANASQDLIDELSDKNLNLTEVCISLLSSPPLFLYFLFVYLFIYSFLSFPLQKVEELNTTLSELEDLRTVSEELEESQAQAMKDLRSELSMFFSFSYSFSCPYSPLYLYPSLAIFI